MRKVTKLMAAGIVALTVGTGVPGISAQAATYHQAFPKSLLGTWKTKGTAKKRLKLHVKNRVRNSVIYETISYKYDKQWQSFDYGLAKSKTKRLSANSYIVKGLLVNSGKSGSMPQKIYLKKKGNLLGVKGLSVKSKYVWFHK